MSAKTRIYVWGERLIRASHPSHVIAHIAAELEKPRVASQDDLERMLQAGVKVETVKPVQQNIEAGAIIVEGEIA